MRISALVATTAVIAAALVGCGGESSPDAVPAAVETTTTAAQESTTTAAQESTTTADSQPELLPLADRAELAGVSLALAESWERKGVHITNTGAIYADDCAAARSVQVPATKRIIC